MNGAGGWSGLLRDGRFWIVVAIVVVLAAVLLLRGGGPESETEAAPEVAAATTKVQVADFPVTIGALGSVVPGPGAEARPAAPAPTRVARVLVAEGDAVRAGQPLVVLDASVFQAQLEQGEAAAASARAETTRLQHLVAEGIAPRKDLEAARAADAQAQAALAEARRNRDQATVRSPIAGSVTAVAVAVGEPVEANQPLVNVVNPAGLSILLQLSPESAARVPRGAEVRLSLSGAELPGAEASYIGTGNVTGISPAVDSTSGSVGVRVVFRNEVRPLRAGESVAARITVGTHARAVVVPVSALVQGDEGVHVFVVDAQGIAHETTVVVGERSDTLAEILSGLHGGELIVSDGAYGVSDGARIRGPAQ